MTNSALSLVYGAALAQAAFLMAALASLRVRHSTARWLLVALVAVFTLLLAEEFLDVAGAPLGLGLGLAVEFALPPLLYLLVSSLFQLRSISFRGAAPHFTPLVLASLALAILNIGAAGPVSLSNPSVRPIVAGIVLIKIAYFFIYVAAALRLALAAEVSEARRNALRTLRALIGAAATVYAFVAAGFIAFLLDVPMVPDSDIIGGVALAVSIYAVGYLGLVNRDVFDRRDSYQGSSLPADEVERLRRRAREHLDTSGAFRDPGFKLRDLAKALGVRPAHLSQALNAGDGGGFHQLLNACRLRTYQAAQADPNNRQKTALELAFDAGFNSKATFYRALKSAEAASPSVAGKRSSVSKGQQAGSH